ncbi:nucleotidyltransferase family protein [Frateuria defendens]|uniref:nucleotidyltransferase family protein n=1 Tax=Frateuria defendens TaxID=2219559 RepID=UPI00066FCCE6|nr:nucleotidyltransferase family protein [Frateuria defendens]
MNGARAIGIVLLAAGEASRYGSPKQLLLVGGQPLVRRQAQAALQVSPWVTVVTGAYRALVEPALDGLSVEVAFHADWSSGMGGSLAYGVRRLRGRQPSLAAVIVCLGDQPAIRADHLASLASAAEGAPGRIVAAAYGDGVRGAPCLFPARCFDELEALHGPEGARRLLARHAGEVQALPMPEARIDIDTPEDYRRWQSGDAG